MSGAKRDIWWTQFDALYHEERNPMDDTLIPGPCPREWARLILHDYDDVDRFLLEAETIGG